MTRRIATQIGAAALCLELSVCLGRAQEQATANPGADCAERQRHAGGVVNNDTDLAMAGMRANLVRGVFSVDNDLQVATSTK